MPWTSEDVERHKKGLTDKGKRQWVAIANSTRKRCIADGDSEEVCDARAIKSANAMVSKEVDMSDLDLNLSEAVMKKEGAESFPASAYLVVEDPEQPSKWHLRVRDAAGKPDHRHMGAAFAALTGGYRGQKYAGPNKAEAMVKLKALYKAEDMPVPGAAEAATEAVARIHEALTMMSLGEQERRIRDAFVNAYGSGGDFVRSRYWVRDVFIAPHEFGNALVAEDSSSGKYMLVAYSEEADRIVFDVPPKWKTVIPTYRVEGATAEFDQLPSAVDTPFETVKLAETYAGAELLTEGIAEADAQGPLTMKIQPIRPGFGRPRDNHYYPAAMLKRDARVMVGAKMYESDHKDDKSTRTWVSTITDVLGFSDMGAPVCEVVVHDPNFAQRIRNLAEKNLLDKMECSILGDGTIKRNQMVEGKKANVVESLTKISSVDWVTKAGAGGKALAIAESEDSMTDKQENDMKLDEGAPPEEPKAEESKAEVPEKPLAEKAVAGILAETNLPESAKTYLAEGAYENTEAVNEAVAKHIEYLKAVTGSGKPFGHEGGGTEVTMDEATYKKRYDGIMESHGVRAFGAN